MMKEWLLIYACDIRAPAAINPVLYAASVFMLY